MLFSDATSCKSGGNFMQDWIPGITLNLLEIYRRIQLRTTTSPRHQGIIADASSSPSFAGAGCRTAKQPGWPDVEPDAREITMTIRAGT